MTHYDYADYDYHELPQYSRIRPYAAFGPFRLLTILMMVVTILLLCMCVACGLMYMADLAEEYPTNARSVLKTLILANLILHGSIMLIDRLSWWRSCLSIVLNVLYLRLLRAFPFIRSLVDPLLCVTVALVLLETTSWYSLCARLLSYTSLFPVIGFFVFLWLVPLGLLSSCVLEEEQLPGTGGRRGGGGGGRVDPLHEGTTPNSPKRKTLLNRFVEFLKTPIG